MKTTKVQQVARKQRFGKRLWVAVRGPIAQSRAVNAILPKLIAAFVRFTYRTNRMVTDLSVPMENLAAKSPVILAIWHGQHLTVPALKSMTDTPVIALFSRSADAEMNARVAAELGLEVVRGSGGRAGVNTVSKGGVKALLALRKALAGGKIVAMIADIAKGKPRESGLGIITLARATGRPILPIAFATSRRYIVERSWDKTTINLPFGRSAVILGEFIFVPKTADDAMMEKMRREVTEQLNLATETAYSLVDNKA
jgi:lysophospholipid acyltransferase (LPLAT)-like uncharacterized protein